MIFLPKKNELLYANQYGFRKFLSTEFSIPLLQLFDRVSNALADHK